MADLTDEVLMAYADGVLERDEALRVETLLRHDADARRRIEIFRMTGAPVSPLFDRSLEVPRHLVDFVLEYEPPAAPPPYHRWAGTLAAWKAWLVPKVQAIDWQYATAAALVAGTGAGWMLHGVLGGSADQQELAVMSQGQIIAKGPLQEVLETAPSNNDVRISGWIWNSSIMRADFTFKSTSGAYCREYQMAVPGSGNFAGLACRPADGPWSIELHLPQDEKPGGASTLPAGPVKMLDPVIGRIMEGDALGKQDEEDLIAKGWK